MKNTRLFASVVAYWRVTAVAVLAGLLAFSGSFLLTPAYEASTRLLIRGRDTTFLTATGEGLSRQPGVVDANMAKALGQTQSALLSTRTVAEMVVGELRLDEPRPAKQGPVAKARSLFAGSYKRARAYLTHGFYAEPNRHEQAVAGVYGGLSAAPLKDSYVIELRATADDPKLAKAIADAAADALVDVSKTRFQEEAATYRDFLAAQVARAAADEATATEAMRKYKDTNGISDVSLEIQLSETAAQQLRDQLEETQVELSGARAEAENLGLTLASATPTDSTTTKIQTGRSETEILSSGASANYGGLLADKQRLDARIAGLQARGSAIEKALAPGVSTGLTAQEAELGRLELQRSIASDTYRDLSTRHQEAVVSAERGTVELTRLDEASAPTYPVSPVRYLYLVLGVLFGGAAGLAVRMLRRRPQPVAGEQEAETPPPTPQMFVDLGAGPANGNVPAVSTEPGLP